MNFLQICQRAISESGNGSSLTTVVSQSGKLNKFVEWCQYADIDIQNLHPNWEFMQSDFSFSTVSGTQSYTPTTAGLTDHTTWKIREYGDCRCYLTTATEQLLEFVPWDSFRLTYLRGTSRDLTGKPTIVTVKPDKTLYFYPTPNDAFTIEGEYYKAAQTMTLDASEPLYPSQFHMAVVWRALMMYGAYEAADERYSHGQNEYKKIIRKLEIDQRPSIVWGPPLV